MRHLKKLLLPLAALSLTGACSLAGGGDPEEALQSMLAKVKARNDLVFEGHSEIQAAGLSFSQRSVIKGRGSSKEAAAGPGGGTLAPDWNPVDKLLQLETIGRKAEWEKGDPTGQGRALAVSVDREQWTKLVVEQWNQELRSIADDQSAKLTKARSELRPADADRLKAEVDAKLAEAGARLEALKTQVTADGRYRIQLDRSSGLPQQLTIETTLRYQKNGQPTEEKWLATYNLEPGGTPKPLPPS